MRKRCRRRHYPVNPAAWQQTVDMQHRMTDDQLRDLGFAVHLAIERMRLGCSLEEDFGALAAAANVSLILCERGVAADQIDLVKRGQDALVFAAERNRRLGKWGFSGPEMQAVNAVIALHEQQIAAVPRALCRDAMREAIRRADRGDVLSAVAA